MLDPPPPYTLHAGSGDDSVQRSDKELQQQGKTSKCRTSICGRALRRIAPGGSRHPKPAPPVATAARVATAATVPTAATVATALETLILLGTLQLPRWYGHYGMTCGHGARSTRQPPPHAPFICFHRYSFDVLFCPPPQPFAPEGARWQGARICFSSDEFSKLRGSIPWRANLDDCCYRDAVDVVNRPYPAPFFLDGSSGKIKTYNYTPSCSTSVGGWTTERTIGLRLLSEETGRPHWSFSLSLTSRDGAWLAGLSRTDDAALAGPDSAIRVIGWSHPDPDSVNRSEVFYVKNLNQPWLETTDLDDRQPQLSPDVSHDVEIRQLLDETIERFIQGGD